MRTYTLPIFFVFISCLNYSENDLTEDSFLKNNVTDSIGANTVELIAQSDEVSFEKFVSKVPLLNEGFKLTCYDQVKHFEPGIGLEFIPIGASIIGRLNSIGDFCFIIYSYPGDIIIPILEVYDNRGNKLNEIQLFDYPFCTDLDANNQYSSFEIISDNEIEVLSFIKNDNAIDVIKQDTIYLMNIVKK